MDRKTARKEYWEKLQKKFIFFIIFLVILLAALIFRDKKFKEKLEHRKYEPEVKTYEGNLQRNISHPLGSE